MEASKKFLDYNKLKTGFPRHEFCYYCQKNRKINYTRQRKRIEYRGKEIDYVELMAWCNYCGWPLDISGMWDEELARIKEIYKETYGK